MTPLPDPASPWPRRPLQRIVCGSDFSAAAQHALVRALQLARADAATLVPAHVMPDSLLPDNSTRLPALAGLPLPTPQTVQAEAAERLQEWIAAHLQGTRLRVEPVVLCGRVDAELARLAAEPAADLLVVGDRGGHTLRAHVLGTTAQRLLQTSPCPVLVVKRPAAAPYTQLLLPTDFSDSSRAAIQAAAALFPHAVLHLAHAFEMPFDGVMRVDIDADAKRRYRQQSERELTARLHRLADELGLPAAQRRLHVANGHPLRCIARWVRSTAADLVVMAAGGRSALERFFIGSVSQQTVMQARADVLLLRGRGFTAAD